MASSMAEKTFIFFLIVLTISPIPATSRLLDELFPQIEVTLSNDGTHPIYFMCKYTDRGDSLTELPPNNTYRFKVRQVAYPMRWCYLYIDKKNNGFFWAYTVRSKCTKCFWSINKFPHLYSGERSRWERQRLFQPINFNISDYLKTPDPMAR